LSLERRVSNVKASFPGLTKNTTLVPLEPVTDHVTSQSVEQFRPLPLVHILRHLDLEKATFFTITISRNLRDKTSPNAVPLQCYRLVIMVAKPALKTATYEITEY
jgi:hypothetical protein